MFQKLHCLLLLLPLNVVALNNGLALTPPMGWLSWARYMCNVDCANDPKNCISEQLYMDIADRLASDGFKNVGYEYINVDDCWMEMKRNASGYLVPDKKRFRSGISALANYVHSKGLKLGMYLDIGTKTCAGYPGTQGYFDKDAKLLAEWDVDMVKVDGCNADQADFVKTYPEFGAALNKTGRPIVYSCSWPAYQTPQNITPDYVKIAKTCNLWRNYDDIEDSWQSVTRIMDYFASVQAQTIGAAGPGHWNDPDMIVGGNFGLSFEEARAQFAIWAILASPLLMSNDLRTLAPEYKALFQNTEVIAVNQDILGLMGGRIYSENQIEIWKRYIWPLNMNKEYSYALVFLNRATLGGPREVSVQLASIGLKSKKCYNVRDLFAHMDIGVFCPPDSVGVLVNPSGASMIVANVLS